MGRYLFGAKDDHKNTPTKVELQNVVTISLKNEHMFALTKKDGLFAWGENTNGECGVDSDKNQIQVPTRVPIPEDYKVDDISAGRYHSIIKCIPKK